MTTSLETEDNDLTPSLATQFAVKRTRERLCRSNSKEMGIPLTPAGSKRTAAMVSIDETNKMQSSAKLNANATSRRCASRVCYVLTIFSAVMVLLLAMAVHFFHASPCDRLFDQEHRLPI